MGKEVDACRRKKRFDDQLSAERHAKSWKNRRGKLTQRPYWCSLCNGWHLTTIDRFKK